MTVRTLLSILLLVSSISLVDARPVPFTAKEVGLMLRAGYSSDAVMRELTVRHFADTCDEATKKMLTQSGASAPLLNALATGTYAIPAAELAGVQDQMAVESKRRAAAAEAAKRFDTLYQHQLAQQRATPTAAQGTVPNSLYPLLKGDLVSWKNGTVNRFDDEALEKKKLFALYFSAHWCAPCRKFTPQLVEYYNRVAPQHPEFEIIFISNDRSQFGFETYLKETQMPWPAIDYQKLSSKAALQKYAGSGIPDLVVLDGSGKVVSDSYAGKEYRGPEKVLADLDQIFAGGGPRVAQGH